METRFSQRLAYLMKERKISGQKIANAVGKSQKTISRYATGEIEPNVVMKNAIYRAIADISGYEEDGMTEAELEEREMIWSFSEKLMESPEYAEYAIGEALVAESERNSANLIETFRKLSLGAKKYYMQNFDTFHMVEDWEVAILTFFHELPAKKQKDLMEYLENFSFNYETLRNVGNLGEYMKMISISQKRPIFTIDNELESDRKNAQARILQEEFENKMFEISMGNRQGNILYYPWYLSYSPYDWYFLLRVKIFELQDVEQVLWKEESPICLGRRLAALLDTIAKED